MDDPTDKEFEDALAKSTPDTRVCQDCTALVHDPNQPRCPECGGQRFVQLAMLPQKQFRPCRIVDPVTHEGCDADGDKVGRDGKTYCGEHYHSSGRDLRDACQEIVIEVYEEFGDEPPQVTDEMILKAFRSGIKNVRRSVAYQREGRRAYKEAVRQLEAIKQAQADAKKNNENKG